MSSKKSNIAWPADLVAGHNLNALLVNDRPSVRHTTGFTGTAGTAFLTAAKKYLVTDFRYLAQARAQCRGVTIINIALGWETIIKKILPPGHRPQRIGFMGSALLYGEYKNFKTKFGPRYQLVPLASDPALWRAVKSPSEIKLLATALEINARAFKKLLPAVRPGRAESSLRAALETNLLQNGAQTIGFDTIIASGVRGALPHGVASAKRLKAGELVTIDFGGTYAGFHADETATIALHKPSVRLKTIYACVRSAQLHAFAKIRPGVAAKALDAAARDYLNQAGYGKYFGHALGHGVGLEIHERPVLSPTSPDIIEPGMVFTIEPGIYIPRLGGVRLEDVVVCTKNGFELLSKIPKNKLLNV